MASTLLKGNLKIGPDEATAVDVSCDVSEFRINRTVAVIDVPAVLCSGIGDKRKGPITEELVINILPDVEATTVWEMFWDAVDDQSAVPPGTLYFEGSLKEQATTPIGPTNPLFYGRFLVTMSETGGVVGELMSSQLTNPIIAGTLVKTETPPTGGLTAAESADEAAAEVA